MLIFLAKLPYLTVKKVTFKGDLMVYGRLYMLDSFAE